MERSVPLSTSVDFSSHHSSSVSRRLFFPDEPEETHTPPPPMKERREEKGGASFRVRMLHEPSNDAVEVHTSRKGIASHRRLAERQERVPSPPPVMMPITGSLDDGNSGGGAAYGAHHRPQTPPILPGSSTSLSSSSFVYPEKDRYIAQRSSQDTSLSHFLLTTEEAITPLQISKAHSLHLPGSTSSHLSGSTPSLLRPAVTGVGSGAEVSAVDTMLAQLAERGEPSHAPHGGLRGPAAASLSPSPARSAVFGGSQTTITSRVSGMAGRGGSGSTMAAGQRRGLTTSMAGTTSVSAGRGPSMTGGSGIDRGTRSRSRTLLSWMDSSTGFNSTIGTDAGLDEEGEEVMSIPRSNASWFHRHGSGRRGGSLPGDPSADRPTPGTTRGDSRGVTRSTSRPHSASPMPAGSTHDSRGTRPQDSRPRMTSGVGGGGSTSGRPTSPIASGSGFFETESGSRAESVSHPRSHSRRGATVTSPSPSHYSPLHPVVLLHVEPYNARLARSLFGEAPQTSVLSHAPWGKEGAGATPPRSSPHLKTTKGSYAVSERSTSAKMGGELRRPSGASRAREDAEHRPKSVDDGPPVSPPLAGSSMSSSTHWTSSPPLPHRLPPAATCASAAPSTPLPLPFPAATLCFPSPRSAENGVNTKEKKEEGDGEEKRNDRMRLGFPSSLAAAPPPPALPSLRVPLHEDDGPPMEEEEEEFSPLVRPPWEQDPFRTGLVAHRRNTVREEESSVPPLSKRDPWEELEEAEASRRAGMEERGMPELLSSSLPREKSRSLILSGRKRGSSRGVRGLSSGRHRLKWKGVLRHASQSGERFTNTFRRPSGVFETEDDDEVDEEETIVRRRADGSTPPSHYYVRDGSASFSCTSLPLGNTSATAHGVPLLPERWPREEGKRITLEDRSPLPKKVEPCRQGTPSLGPCPPPLFVNSTEENFIRPSGSSSVPRMGGTFRLSKGIETEEEDQGRRAYGHRELSGTPSHSWLKQRLRGASLREYASDGEDSRGEEEGSSWRGRSGSLLESGLQSEEEDEEGMPSSSDPYPPHLHPMNPASLPTKPTRTSLSSSGPAASMHHDLQHELQRFNERPGVVFKQNKEKDFVTRSFRYIPKTPDHVLDALNVVDEFYYNILDCSCKNTLAVALWKTPYLWEWSTATTFILPKQPDPISALRWAPEGECLASSDEIGDIILWDAHQSKECGIFTTHHQRVCALAWNLNGKILASGSRDRRIILHDIRRGTPAFCLSNGHTGEICGLQWSLNDLYLASGADDNRLLVWDSRRLETPLHTFTQHTAAVKAVAWHPLDPHLLLSGGGANDASLRFWRADTGECIKHVVTPSQVSGVVWHPSGTELASSHGHPNNQIILWRYPSLNRITELSGHRRRVLHICLSAEGETVVSLGADQSVRFWRCFPPVQNEEEGTLEE